MTFHIITIFPNMFDSYLGESILARAIKEKKIKVKFYNPRDFVRGKLRKVWPDGNISSKIDDRPYGGGPGMVMIADPIIRAWESARGGSASGGLPRPNNRISDHDHSWSTAVWPVINF